MAEAEFDTVGVLRLPATTELLPEVADVAEVVLAKTEPVFVLLPVFCAAVALAVLAFAVLVAVSERVLVVELLLPRSSVSVWLMLISCSRLLTCTNWLMYSLGSVVEVGS